MNKIVIFGTGKIAEQTYHYLVHDSPYRIVAFTVDRKYITKGKKLGCPIVPFEDIDERFPPADYQMFVAVGYQNLNELRTRKCHEARKKGYDLVSYFSPKASNYGKVKIGKNCLVLEYSIIQPYSYVGDNVFIWSGNHIGHHATIKDNCYLSGQVIVSGGVTVEADCFIGVNATIGHEVTIGQGSFIGAGTLITKDVAPGSVYIAPDTPKYRLPAPEFLRLSKMEGLSAT